MTTVRDRLWLFAHEAGSHDDRWELPQTSRITPVEAAHYLAVPNVIMVRYRGQPAPPYDQYAVPFASLRQVVWSVVGSAGITDAAEQDHVLALADRLPNLTGVFMDDFFRSSEEEPGVFSVQQLHQLRSRLRAGTRRLDLWVVLYDHQLHLPVGPHLQRCDKVTFWTWESPNLHHLEPNLRKAKELAEGRDLLLGCYLWDYGRRLPMPLERMQQQCNVGLDWLREDRIDGLIFLASCICDLGLETVEWTRDWIAEVGDLEL